ncbi:hypothetical protein NUM3379_44020 [Kineococcus sp. NUM-3379]
MSEGTGGQHGAHDASWQAPQAGDQPPRPWEAAPGAAGAPPAYGATPPPRGGPGAAPAWGPAAPRPGIVPLRPLGLGEIYDGAFRAFRQNPRVMVGLSTIVVAATTLLTLFPSALLAGDIAALGAAAETSQEVPLEQLSSTLTRGVPGFLVTVALQSIAVTVLNGLLIVAVSRAVLAERVGLGQLWSTARRRVPALLVLALLLALYPLVLLALAIGPGIALLASENVAAGVAVLLLSSLAALVVGVWLYVRWSLAAPVLLLEGAGVLTALRRSAELVRGSFWRVLGIVLLTLVIVMAVVTALSVPFSLLSGLIGTVVLVSGDPVPSLGVLLLQQAVAGLGTIATGAVAYPFSASVTALLYIDLRMRREGLDVELHRAAAGRPGPARW